jgi:hypothetical protein
MARAALLLAIHDMGCVLGNTPTRLEPPVTSLLITMRAIGTVGFTVVTLTSNIAK